ncbi:UNVERIFIED_CONTAM: trxB, partial [Trichonephila clavipes]
HIEAETVIIATGATAKWLGLDSEQKYNGFGVSACAVCDGFFFKGQDVAIVGAGDTAAEEATYLAKLARKVYMLVRRDEFRASKAMVHRVMNTENIEVLYNTETEEILGDGQVVTGLRVKNNQTEANKRKENKQGTSEPVRPSNVVKPAYKKQEPAKPITDDMLKGLQDKFKK